MLRRFNSLIKGPKGQASDEELSELHLSLRPALSVDSSLFSSSQHLHVNPLQQQLALAREEGLARARRTSDNGQTSVMNGASLQQQVNEGFVIARVPEEKSWKEGYEHGILNPPLDSPRRSGPSHHEIVKRTALQQQASTTIRNSRSARLWFLPNNPRLREC